MAKRNTETQAAVLNLLRGRSSALCHDDVMEELTTEVNRVTVYRILNRFVDQGLAHRIVADDGKQYFASCATGCSHGALDHGHVHFRCTDCERIECLDQPLNVNLPKGYVADNFNVLLSGTCAACAS